MSPATIGFLGTGLMGAPMARHLCRAGHAVRVWNRTSGKAAALAAEGARIAGDPREAARGADAVICMVSSGPVSDEVLLGPEGALAAMRPGSVLAVMSSIPVGTARRQAEIAAASGVGYVDAPVSGGEAGAVAGALAIMAGGSPEAFAQLRPILAAMGRPTHVGPAGSGQLAKLANQAIVASTLVTVAEAITFVARGGADPAKVREALLGGFADSTILRQHAPRMIERNFTPGGPAKYQLKDTGTALAHAAALGLTLPVLSLVDRLFADLIESGDGDLDHSAIIRTLWRRNDPAAGPAPQAHAASAAS
ncbi:NAD(P)-dependent oxidoreductase [Methylobacterium isbiliense]|jgi:3-hydroxyisobutyrate dehydrogenase-like beta-hydroxyacid dehydrogenase|uniref:2-hydroxy-3-oxopropionate reductase n=1 Tax=Methylobacterium isbiliense TaxID=315478 RepID=A0ABQ4SGR0_9HYPH|nr:NAD(P)-dependent oxidoreductase [Methylobacterium isbiliense]MDN3626039.1 NAD(P)-dependent oxidoreductase [Methylobacterium isbiliense]GJE02312.1 2-hydroxy-3-oxopropionate reductase [Methylobacterium isbiliense]